MSKFSIFMDMEDRQRVFLRNHIAFLLEEEGIELDPMVASGNTIDLDGLMEFLKGKGLMGYKEDIVGIIEGMPSTKVINDVEEYGIFHKEERDMNTMRSEEIMDIYLKWNGIDVNVNEILAFSISEEN